CKNSQKSAVVGGGDGESGVRQLLDGLDGLASASASETDAAPPLHSRYESNNSPESSGYKNYDRQVA
ncbi:unnamed protein product, partial [Heterotrigona itama]